MQKLMYTNNANFIKSDKTHASGNVKFALRVILKYIMKNAYAHFAYISLNLFFKI